MFTAVSFRIVKNWTQMPSNWWVDKQIAVHPHNRILLSHTKDWTPKTSNNMDNSQKHYAKWERPDSKG